MSFSEKQLEIFKFAFSDKDVLICDGAVRSGKTMCMAVAFVLFAFDRFNETNFGICGKTVGSCIKNVIRPLMSLTYMREEFKMNFKRGENLLVISRMGHTNYFYVYGGKDERSQDYIQGITLGGVLLDEVALMPQSFVNQALSRCSLEGAKLWFNCNPENPSHWFYQEWILGAAEKNALHLHFLMTDNPSLSQKTLDDYQHRYKGAFYRRYILGEWVRAEGLVYPMFDPDRHIIDEYDRRGRYFITIDYGTLNPTVYLLWRVNYNFRECPIICVKEYYYSGRAEGHTQKTDAQYYDDLEEFADGYRIDEVIVDPSAASFKTLIRQKGKFDVHDANNDVLDGLRFTGTLIQDGYVYFDRSCENCFAEFGAYVWDDDSETDRVIKENDHCLTGDTVVHTVNGKIPIKNLVGKTGGVLSFNLKTDKAEYADFAHVRLTRHNAKIVKITMISGIVAVRCTDDHLIYAQKRNKPHKEYIPAGQLEYSDYIVNCVSGYGTVEMIKSVEFDGYEDVYNMEVEGNHNFAVNGGYIVHNCMDAMRYMMYTVIRKDNLYDDEEQLF